MQMNFKKLTDTAVTPTYGTNNSAGMDMYAEIPEGSVTVKAGETSFIGTGIATAIPEGYVGLLFARSGLACKSGLAPANKVGVIDADYRGEIKVALHNHTQEDKTVNNHDRIAQLAIIPYLKVELNEVDDLEATDRGEGGFGSTGK